MNLNNLSAYTTSTNLVENSLKNRPKDNNTGSGPNTNNKSSSLYKNFHRSKPGSRSRSRSSSCSSNKSFTPISASQSGNANIKRYTRSTLYLLRNESYARRRPECSLRCELQSLGVWKFSIINNTSISAGCGGSISQTLNGSTNNNIPSNNGSEPPITGLPLNSISSALSVNNLHSQHANSRTQRSPAVTTSYHSHIYTHSNQHQTQSLQKFNNNSNNYLDHRSISSSHLMPAFAKRRIVSSGTSGNRTSVTQNVFTSTNQNSTTSTPASNTQSDTSHNESEGSNHRHQQRRSVEIENNMSSSNYLSPQRSDADIDREYGSKSPNLSTSLSSIHGRHTSLNTSLVQERRIGSGRLLPRDVTNWSDYPGLKSNDSNGVQQDYKEGNKVHNSAVDSSSNRNATRGRGIFDSSNSNINANSMSVGENLIALMERRSYERRHNISNNDDKCEREPSRYRTLSQDANQTQQQGRHNRRQQQSHSNQYSYHSNYNDRLEEPEWFSSGPTSQHDTIELRGFDETDENYDNIGTELYRHNDKRNSTNTCKQNENSLSQTNSAANLNISKNVKSKSSQPISDAEETVNTDIDIDIGANVKKTAPSQNKSIIPSKNSTKTSASGYDTDDSHFINSDEEQIPGTHIVDTGNDSDNMQKSINSFKKEEMRKTTCSTQEQNTKTNTVEGFQSECDNIFNTFFQGKQRPSDTADIGVKKSIGHKDHTDIEMFDAFFKSDSLKHNLLVLQENSANENSAAITSSRFSRWFVNEDINEDVNKAKFSSYDINSTDNKIFHQSRAPTFENNTLLEFIQRSKLPTSLQNGAAHPNSIPSVGELEAKMRQMDVNTNKTILNNIEHSSESNTEHLAPQESQTPGEIEAFKKLLEQLGTVNKYQNQQQLSEQSHLINYQNRKLISASGILTQDNSQMNMIVQHDSNSTNNVSNVISNVASSMLNAQLQKDDVQKLHQEIYHQQQMPPQKHVVHTKEPQVDAFDAHPLPTNESITAQNPLPSLHMPQFATYLQSKRLDSQHLLQCVARGEIEISFLEQELNNPNINPKVREIITSVLGKNSSRIIASNRPITDTTATDGMTTSSASNIMQVLPHHIQQQYSSILYSQSNTFGTHLTSNVILPNSMVISSTHASTTQQKLQQGIGTSRDPGFNTQTFIQTAAIKKKIDEHQHETLKKQQQSHLLVNQFDSQLKNVQQPLQQVQLQAQQHQRHSNSPTPLAFTPTSVLRKMTADKENTTGSSSSHISLGAATNNLHQPISSKQQNTQTQQQLTQTIYLGQPHQPPNTFSVSQPRMILGVGSGAQHMQHQNNNNSESPQHKEFLSGTPLRSATQQQMKWPCTSTHQMVINQMLPPTNIKPLGRPILKGSTSTTQQSHQSLPEQATVSAPQTTFPNKIDIQQLNQQHKVKHNITSQRMVHHHSHLQQTQQQQAFSSPKAHIPPTQQQLYQHQQQLRVLAFQRPQHFQQQLHHRPNHQQYDTANRTLCPIIVGGNGNPCPVNINSTTTGSTVSTSVGGAGTGMIDYQREGGLSPTSNQLAQWFSPELLAQASAGKLPLLNMNQALSLEEFERSIQQHSSTTVVQN